MTVTARPPHVQRVTHTAAPTASRLVVGLTFLAVASLGAAGQSAPTFSRDIAPIFFEHCAGCHRPGQSAPFSLLTFEDARPWARAIRQEVATRQMPPWKPEPGYGDFARVRRLSDGQIAMIDRWVEGGATEGDRADLPRTPRWTEGWQLGAPDLVIEMPEPYTVPAEGEDIFRSFAVPVPISQTRYVRAVELNQVTIAWFTTGESSSTRPARHGSWKTWIRNLGTAACSMTHRIFLMGIFLDGCREPSRELHLKGSLGDWIRVRH